MNCPKCGCKIAGNSRKCMVCGNVVDGDSINVIHTSNFGSNGEMPDYNPIEEDDSPTTFLGKQSGGYSGSSYTAPSSGGYNGSSYIAPSSGGYNGGSYSAPSQGGYNGSSYTAPSQGGYNGSSYSAPSSGGYNSSGYSAPSTGGYNGSSYSTPTSGSYNGTGHTVSNSVGYSLGAYSKSDLGAYGGSSARGISTYQIIKIVGASILLLGSLFPFFGGANVLQGCIGSFGILSIISEYSYMGMKTARILFAIALILQPIMVYGAIALLTVAILKTGKPAYRAEINAARAVLGVELIIALSPIFFEIYTASMYEISPHISCSPGMIFLLIGLLVSFIGCNQE